MYLLILLLVLSLIYYLKSERYVYNKLPPFQSKVSFEKELQRTNNGNGNGIY